MSPTLKFLTDLGPLAVFFITYRMFGIMEATGALVVATLIALMVTYHFEKTLPVMPLMTAIAVTVFGGLSIYLNDELFIKMKPTILNLIFAAILLIGLLFNRPMLKYLLQTAITLQERGWRLLSLRWGVYFIFLAALNEYIWRNYSTDFWVDFKVFGMFTLTLVFTALQLPLFKRYMIEE